MMDCKSETMQTKDRTSLSRKTVQDLFFSKKATPRFEEEPVVPRQSLLCKETMLEYEHSLGHKVDQKQTPGKFYESSAKDVSVAAGRRSENLNIEGLTIPRRETTKDADFRLSKSKVSDSMEENVPRPSIDVARTIISADVDAPVRKKRRKTKTEVVVDNKDSQTTVMELSQHVMYDWAELGLGDIAGSGAWNRALRTQFIRANNADFTSVPQLSSLECLHRIQQAIHLPAILPPPSSILVQPLISNNDLKVEKPECFEQMRELYREMLRQDSSDGFELRRDLRFTTADQLCDRMRQAQSQTKRLANQEKRVRRIGERMGVTDWQMQQEVNQCRGII